MYIDHIQRKRIKRRRREGERERKRRRTNEPTREEKHLAPAASSSYVDQVNCPKLISSLRNGFVARTRTLVVHEYVCSNYLGQMSSVSTLMK